MIHSNRRTALKISLFLLLTLISWTAIAQTITKHQLSVNFISVGSGIDTKANAQLRDCIAKFQQDNRLSLEYNVKPCGKEGEIEYVFNLKKLQKKQRKTFQDTVREMFKENKMVKVSNAESGSL